jgi:Icc-related predicted phosphoesterase
LKINLLSDIHSEFWREKDYRHPGTGDVLVLAGDIGVAEDLYDEDSMFQRFLRDCVAGYDKVFMVLGNHSHYNFNFKETEKLHRELMPKGITLLQNQSEFYGGLHWVGATLWTDFNNGSPSEMQKASECMNDYRIITHGDRPLQPSDTLHEHDETVTWFNQVLPTLRGKVVMITHHCPTPQSLSGRYAGGLTGAYATDMTRMIHQYAPELWFHGHCHESADYTVGSTRVVSNPYGYSPDMINANFIPSFEIDV